MFRRRRYPLNTLWNEFDDMMAEMETKFQSALSEGATLPARLLPAIKGECRVDVRDQDEETIVVADLPGVNKEDLNLNLIDPFTLEISCERKSDILEEEEETGYYMRERTYGFMKRTIPLPCEVSEEGATASFKNGVLEVNLKKVITETGTKIQID